jgi:hypothetical protein
LANLHKDPFAFVMFAFPWGEEGTELEHCFGPEPWQEQFLKDLRDYSPQKALLEAVSSGHGVGKSTLVAWIIIWAISTCRDTRGVVTANTETQLKTKTFRLEASGIFSREPEHERTWRIDVVPWSERNTEAFAGLHNQGRRILVVFDEACHDEQTEVMTASGWKFFADVAGGDELLTMDPLTRAAEYVAPTHLHASYHNGEMISYRRRGASFLVTPNHRMYVRSQKGYWSMREAGELADCDNVEVFLPRTFTRTVEDLSEVCIPEFAGVRKTWPTVSFAADDFMRFAGWYCSEGSLGYKSGRPVDIRITQRDPEEIHALCRRLGLSCGVSRFPGRAADQVLIYGTHLAQFFAAYGRGAKNKRAPDFVREASSRQINIFLDTFRDGDGYRKTDGRDILYTSSKGMADDLQELIHLAGGQSTITTRDLDNKEINFGTHIARSTGIGYVVSRTAPSDLTLRTSHIERVPYTGMVYCATLPKHGLLFTRRDGVCMWSGNSAIPDAIWETTQGALTDANTEIIWAVFGNPTRNDGRFKQCFAGGQFAHRWRTRTVDSREVSFTDKAQIKRWIDDYGDDDDFVRVRVKGTFPRIGNLQFIDSAVAAEAGKRETETFGHDPLVVGVDVARFGDDASVFYTRRGRDGRTIAPQIFRGLDTMGLAARLAEHVMAHRPDAVFIDGGGVGGGVIDRCRQLGVMVFEVQFGGRPDRPDVSVEQNRYANKRAEIWGMMREWLRVGAIPNDQQLIAELTLSQYGFNSRDEIQLESKTDLRRRGAGSPDMADALALTFAWPVLPRDLAGGERPKAAMAETEYDPFAEERAA